MAKDELKALKEKAEAIKKDTLDFIGSAKKLSKFGIEDAKNLASYAKANWKSVLGVAAALGIGGALLRKKGKSSKSKKAKPAVKKRKTK